MPLLMERPDAGGVIHHDPRVLGGQAVVAGTRIPIWMIVDLYRAEGWLGVRAGYPSLTEDEVRAALAYAHSYAPAEIAADRQAYYDAIPEHLRD